MAYHFNNRIEIYKRVSSGPYPDEYEMVTIAKPWADVKTIKGREFFQSNMTISEMPVRFIIRYRKGIETNMRINWKGKDYDIESVQNDNGLNQTLTLYGKTVQ